MLLGGFESDFHNISPVIQQLLVNSPHFQKKKVLRSLLEILFLSATK